MWIRAMCVPTMLFAVGCVDPSDAATVSNEGAADQATVEQDAAAGTAANGGFQCLNKASLQVGCIGQIGVLPFNINIKNARILSNNELFFLNNDLNNLAILEGGVLSGDDILNDVKATVLDDFLNLFHITVLDSLTTVCTNVLGVQFCK